MMPICSGVTMMNATSRHSEFLRGAKRSHTTMSSTNSVNPAENAWNECGHCCTYQPIHDGSGPFS